MLYPRLTMGVPRALAGLIWGSAFFLVFAGGVWWFLIVAGVVHVLAAWITSKDPLMPQTVMRAIRSPQKTLRS